VKDLSGRVAFVTGAASGIGLGICRAALNAGMKVMMADIEAPVLERSHSLLSQEFSNGALRQVICDVSDRNSVKQAAQSTIEQFGKVHLVCNNAGVSSGGLLEECDDGDWDWLIGVNYLGVLHGCQAFIPHIKGHGEGGHIVNTSSMAGLLGGMAGWGPYNSTKFAVVGLTEVLRQEGREHGFGASVLCPGGVATNIFDAPRNRPDRFGPQVSETAYDNPGEGIEDALSPDIVGELVLEAVQNNILFIFTDPRFVRLLQRRHERMMADLKWAGESDALEGAPGSSR
jgi:NAD(P)-dependent dehydrogenase (short-subunit alcohol dehydrogenase family)